MLLLMGKERKKGSGKKVPFGTVSSLRRREKNTRGNVSEDRKGQIEEHPAGRRMVQERPYSCLCHGNHLITDG